MNLVGFQSRPAREIRGCSRHQIERRFRLQQLALAQITRNNGAPVTDAIPGDGAAGQLRADGLRLDASNGRCGEPPRHQQQHRSDATTQIQDARGIGADAAAGEMRRDQIVQREPMAVGALQEAPVAGQPAEIFIGVRPQQCAIRGRLGRGAGRGPSDRTTGGAHDAAPGRNHILAAHQLHRSRFRFSSRWAAWPCPRHHRSGPRRNRCPCHQPR